MNGMIEDIWPWDDLAIGTKFKVGNNELEVVEDDKGGCNGCYFNIRRDYCSQFKCSSNERSDNKDVVYTDINFKSRIIQHKQQINRHVLNRSQIIELIEKKYNETGNELYKELLNEIG